MNDTFKYDFSAGDFVLENGTPVVISGRDALKAWIEKCLRTPLNRYLIYKNKTYGANIEDLVIGNSYGAGFTAAELKREIENALLQNSDITAVTACDISRSGDLLNIDIVLDTVYGKEVYSYDS